MIALIRTENGFYCSTIFAYYVNGYDSSVIAFNENNSRLINVLCNNTTLFKGIRRDVFFADDGKDGWIDNGKWSGFSFIVNDKNLLKNIKKGDNIPADILDKCMELQTDKTFTGWNKIETDKDIEMLMNISLNFHDGVIDSIEVHGNDTYVKFNCWSCTVTLKFSNTIENGISENRGNNYILEADMQFEDGKINWCADSICFDEKDEQDCYFIAESAQFKIE